MQSAARAGAEDHCKPILALESYNESRAAPQGSTCSSFLGQSGHSGTVCFWEFAYRDAKAKETADRFWEMVALCRIGKQRAVDLPVNHPDTYELREWITKDVTYSVSLKDKTGQERTLVSIRLQHN